MGMLINFGEPDVRFIFIVKTSAVALFAIFFCSGCGAESGGQTQKKDELRRIPSEIYVAKEQPRKVPPEISLSEACKALLRDLGPELDDVSKRALQTETFIRWKDSTVYGTGGKLYFKLEEKKFWLRTSVGPKNLRSGLLEHEGIFFFSDQGELQAKLTIFD